MMMTRTMPLMHKIAALAFSFALVAALIPASAIAETSVTGMSGNSGSCQWEINQDGKLIIEPTAGSTGTLASYGDLYDAEMPPWIESDYSGFIRSVEIRAGVKAGESLHNLFAGLDRVKSIDLSGLDTSDTKNMSGLFYYCSSLTSITFGPLFNTSQVTDMGSMFFGASQIDSLNLTRFDTKKVENMAGMFYDCSSLTGIGVSTWATPNLNNMRLMFAGCKSLVALDLSNFDTSSVSDMGGLFNGCSSLKSLNLSSFDTSKVIDMTDFMANCKELEKVDVGENFEFIGDGCRLPAGNWYAADGNLYSADEIAANPDIPGPFTKEQPNTEPPVVTLPDDDPIDVGSGEDLKIKTDIDPEDLVCVKVDGEVVDPSNYTIDERTGEIVFKPEFLETLPNGDHEIGFVTATGTASVPVSITGSSAQPKPGTPGNPSNPGNSGGDGDNNGPGSNGSGNGDSNGSALGYGHVMYRMYNPNSGEHFFTTNPTERDRLDNLGWDYEGIAWVAPPSGTPVYRVYNANAGEHHYTKDIEERDILVGAGWQDEGIGWYADIEQRIPLYRVYNPNEYANNHHYTTSAEERDSLMELGWQDEGIGWHGMAAGA